MLKVNACHTMSQNNILVVRIVGTSASITISSMSATTPSIKRINGLGFQLEHQRAETILNKTVSLINALQETSSFGGQSSRLHVSGGAKLTNVDNVLASGFECDIDGLKTRELFE